MTAMAAVIRTELGDIAVELFPDQAPVSVANFIAHVDAGLFRETGFYRVARADNEVFPDAPAQLIQGGIGFNGGSPLPGVAHEPELVTELKPLAGTVGLARDEPGTAASEFFINMTDNPSMRTGSARGDGLGIAIFGRVTAGMDVARAIQSGATGRADADIPELAHRQMLVQPIRIIDIERR
jgi:peptidyl-prolyl cis-trans isomerase A (cyclophilin A)